MHQARLEADTSGHYRHFVRVALPSIGIPLRESDAEVPLSLQAIIEQCYENRRYDDVDYRREPDPPLEPDDAAWADEILRRAGKR